MVSKLLAQTLIDKKYVCVSDSTDFANLTLSDVTLPSDKDIREDVKEWIKSNQCV